MPVNSARGGGGSGEKFCVQCANNDREERSAEQRRGHSTRPTEWNGRNGMERTDGRTDAGHVSRRGTARRRNMERHSRERIRRAANRLIERLGSSLSRRRSRSLRSAARAVPTRAHPPQSPITATPARHPRSAPLGSDSRVPFDSVRFDSIRCPHVHKQLSREPSRARPSRALSPLLSSASAFAECTHRSAATRNTVQHTRCDATAR